LRDRPVGSGPARFGLQANKPHESVAARAPAITTERGGFICFFNVVAAIGAVTTGKNADFSDRFTQNQPETRVVA
jgi:hypothetical protein